MYIEYKSEIKYEWKNYVLCAITLFITKNGKYKKGNA